MPESVPESNTAPLGAAAGVDGATPSSNSSPVSLTDIEVKKILKNIIVEYIKYMKVINELRDMANKISAEIADDITDHDANELYNMTLRTFNIIKNRLIKKIYEQLPVVEHDLNHALIKNKIAFGSILIVLDDGRKFYASEKVIRKIKIDNDEDNS
jgi:hypothetical protein